MNTVTTTLINTNAEPLSINNQSPISSLPQDMIEIILQNTNDVQKQQASFVCKLWCAASINAAKNDAFSPINVCLKLLGQNYHTEKNAIVEAIKGTKIENLQQVKTKTDNLREKIINVLQSIELSNLDTLSKGVKTSALKNNLFALAKMYQEIDLIEKGPLTSLKIFNKINTLIACGQFYKVVEVAFEKFSFEDSYKRSVIAELRVKLSILPAYRQIKTVTQLLENFLNAKDDENLKKFICPKPLLLVNIFNFAAKTDDFASQYPTFGNMLGALLNYKEGSDIELMEASSMLVKSLPSNLLADIAISLLDQGKNKDALKVALEIQDPDLKKSTLAKIQGPSLTNCIIM